MFYLLLFENCVFLFPAFQECAGYFRSRRKINCRPFIIEFCFLCQAAGSKCREVFVAGVFCFLQPAALDIIKLSIELRRQSLAK